jgi:hypothetical protein
MRRANLLSFFIISLLVSSLSSTVVYAVDTDGDTYDSTVDCNDNDIAINPGATEVCDGIDNDCDGNTDEDDDSLDITTKSTWYVDADGDDFGYYATTVSACAQPTGYVNNSSDCDDDDGDVNPDMEDICYDDIDNDCDEAVDGGCAGLSSTDDDGDGYSEDDGDCDDTDETIFPDATETCDEVDNNCDGAIDESTATDVVTWYYDADGDGFGNEEYSVALCDRIQGYVQNAADCDDSDAAINGGSVEYCSSDVDEDCDGEVDEADCEEETTTASDNLQYSNFTPSVGSSCGLDEAEATSSNDSENVIIAGSLGFIWNLRRRKKTKK